MWGLPEHGNLRKHQSSSTIWVFRWLQLISHIVTFSVEENCSKLNRRLMSRGFFHHHHIQLHLKIMDSLFTDHHVPKSQERGLPCGVYCRSLLGPWPSVAPWQTEESPLPQRTVYDCFNVVTLVFGVPAKTQPHIN